LNWRAEGLAIWAFAVRNLIMASRNVFFFFELLFWPVIGVVSIGLLSRFLDLAAPQTAFILIGTIALSVVQVCQLEVSYAVLYDVWSKSMKHQFLAPIGVRHLTIGSWLVGVLRGLVIFVLLGALAWWAFDFDVLEAGGPAVAAFLAGCFLTAWAVGVAVCALVTLFGTRAEAFAWASANFVLVFAGIYYPVSVLPEPAAAVATAIPLAHFLDAFRAQYGFTPEFAAPVTTGLVLAVAYVGLSHWALAAAIRRSRRNGRLLSMSE
jgi:ABC-2 type transport system permease protein